MGESVNLSYQKAKEFAEKRFKKMKKSGSGKTMAVPTYETLLKKNSELFKTINYKDMSEKLQDLTTFVESRSSAMMSDKSQGCYFYPMSPTIPKLPTTQESDYNFHQSEVSSLRLRGGQAPTGNGVCYRFKTNQSSESGYGNNDDDFQEEISPDDMNL